MNITHSPPSKMIHVEADIPLNQRDEFDRAILEITAGARPRMDALERDLTAIKSRALLGLHSIEDVIRTQPTSGQAKSLVRFLAGIYNGADYPFDLTELRGLDIELASACLDYLNYDRLGEQEVHEHLTNGAHDLKHWLKDHVTESASGEL
jgi:hypothetical protein